MGESSTYRRLVSFAASWKRRAAPSSLSAAHRRHLQYGAVAIGNFFLISSLSCSAASTSTRLNKPARNIDTTCLSCSRAIRPGREKAWDVRTSHTLASNHNSNTFGFTTSSCFLWHWTSDMLSYGNHLPPPSLKNNYFNGPEEIKNIKVYTLQ
jgi:hypothetical protein